MRKNHVYRMLSFALQSNHILNKHIKTRHVQRGGGRSSGRLSSSELRSEFENRHLKCFSCPTQNASSRHSTGRDNEKNENFNNFIGSCIVSQPVYRRPG